MCSSDLGEGGVDRVGERAPIKRKTDQTLKHISHNDEDIGERASPCRRPFLHLIQSPGTPLRRTEARLE